MIDRHPHRPVAATLLLLCGTALAQTDVDTGAFGRCAALSDDAERLACFDALASGPGPDTAPPPAVSQTTPPGPSAPAEQAPTVIAATILEVTRLARSGKLRVTLDNGEVWQETDGRRYRGTLRQGTRVTISERPVSGFRLDTEDRSATVYVRRIR